MSDDNKQVATLQQKEQAWELVGKRRHEVDSRFFWVTQTCDLIHPTQMHTSHLFNALKMMWNNSVQEQYQIVPYRKWGGIPQMEKHYKRKAIANLFAELMNRDDRTEGMNEALRKIAEYVTKHWNTNLLKK
jgi:hypothetical protein